jgi:GTP-binding protein HflX
VIAIVGYTNAGKSTLLNTLTNAGVLAEDKLFATLDTRARQLRLPSGRSVIVTDTVGFIRRMPRDLFAAFRATFEETADADLIVEVVDVSDPEHPEHMEETARLLAELGLDQVQRLTVFNKIDRLPVHELEALETTGEVILCSALSKSHTRHLLEVLEESLPLGRPRADAADESRPDVASPPHI